MTYRTFIEFESSRVGGLSSGSEGCDTRNKESHRRSWRVSNPSCKVSVETEEKKRGVGETLDPDDPEETR